MTISVVAILAALLLPAFRDTVKKAMGAKCVSNLRQLSSACLSYAGDSEGKLPFTYVAGGNWSGFGSPLWYVELAPYVGGSAKNAAWGELSSAGIFKCPADRVPWVGGSPGQFLPSCSYAFPMRVAGVSGTSPLRIGQIPEQANTVMLLDCAFGNVFNPGQSGSTMTASNDPAESMAATFDRHGGLNAVFFDGHCELLKAPLSSTAPANRPTLWGPTP